MVEEAHTEPAEASKEPMSLEEQVKAQQEQIDSILKKLQILEADEDEYYPQDTYSFISLNSPDHKDDNFSFFLFGIAIWAFQILFIVLLGASVFVSFYDTEDYYAGDLIMAITEFAAILAYAVIPDASVQDMVTANRQWPLPGQTVNVTGRKIASALRLIQGVGASVCVLFLINVSPTAIDIILNFAALNFVSDMDSVAFELASKGVFGVALKDECERVQSTKLPERVGDVTIPYRFAMISCFVAMTTVNAVLTAYPAFAKSLYTSHSLPELGTTE